MQTDRLTPFPPKPLVQIVVPSYCSKCITFLLFGVELQGIFFMCIDKWVATSEFYSLLPYKLFPTDLFLLPIAFCLCIPLLDKRIIRPDMLLLLNYVTFFLIILMWIVLGFANHNPNVLADFRSFFLRPLLSIPFYVLASKASRERLETLFIRLNFALLILFSIVCFLSWMLYFANLRPSQFGFLSMLPALSLFLIHFLYSRHISNKSVFFIFLFFILVMLSVIKSVVASLVICSLLTIFLDRGTAHKLRNNWVKIFIMSIILIFVILTIILAFPAISSSRAVDHVRTAYLKQNAAIRDLSGGRLQIWSLYLGRWNENPLLGNGFGWYASGDLVSHGTGQMKHFDIIYSHNIIVQLLGQMGTAGILLLLAVLSIWLRRRRRRAQSLVDASYRLHHAVSVAVLTLLIASLFGQYLTVATTGYLFWACMGLEAGLARGAALSTIEPQGV